MYICVRVNHSIDTYYIYAILIRYILLKGCVIAKDPITSL